jgi:protein AFG1
MIAPPHHHHRTYRLVSDGRLQRDASQVAAVQTLQLLQSALVAHVKQRAATPQPADDGGSTPSGSGPGAPPSSSLPQPASTVQGAYLWGPIGSGKTMLMDLFSRTLPPSVIVRREHLHGLLTHVHERCHQLQEALPRIVVKSRLGLPVYR